MKRLGVILSLFILGAVLVAVRTTPPDTPTPTALSQTEDYLLHAREDQYLISEQDAYLGAGPVLLSPAPTAMGDERTGDSIDVLIIGDSFTYGYALLDPYMRWPWLLRDILTTSQPDISYNIDVLAEPSTDLLEYAAWVDELRVGRVPSARTMGTHITPEEISVDRYSGLYLDEYDVVIVGYLYNDIEMDIPGVDGDYLVGDGDYETSLIRYDALEKGDEMLSATITDAFKRISSIGDTLLIAPLDTSPTHWDLLEPVWPLAEVAGGMVISMDATADLSRLHATDESPLRVSVSDGHPSPYLMNAYATDVAAALTSVVPIRHVEERNREDVREIDTATPFHVIPGRLDVTETDGRGERHFTISYTDSTLWCYPYSNPLLTQTCMDGPMLIGPEGQMVPQTFPCKYLSRPYAIVLFSRELSTYNLTLSVPDSSLLVWTLAYTQDLQAVFTDLNEPDGAIIDLTDVRGLAVSHNGRTECPVRGEDESLIDMPPFEFSITMSTPTA